MFGLRRRFKIYSQANCRLTSAQGIVPFFLMSSRPSRKALISSSSSALPMSRSSITSSKLSSSACSNFS